jgi:hypothetical protein
MTTPLPIPKPDLNEIHSDLAEHVVLLGRVPVSRVSSTLTPKQADAYKQALTQTMATPAETVDTEK